MFCKHVKLLSLILFQDVLGPETHRFKRCLLPLLDILGKMETNNCPPTQLVLQMLNCLYQFITGPRHIMFTIYPLPNLQDAKLVQILDMGMQYRWINPDANCLMSRLIYTLCTVFRLGNAECKRRLRSLLLPDPMCLKEGAW